MSFACIFYFLFLDPDFPFSCLRPLRIFLWQRFPQFENQIQLCTVNGMEEMLMSFANMKKCLCPLRIATCILVLVYMTWNATCHTAAAGISGLRNGQAATGIIMGSNYTSEFVTGRGVQKCNNPVR